MNENRASRMEPEAHPKSPQREQFVLGLTGQSAAVSGDGVEASAVMCGSHTFDAKLHGLRGRVLAVGTVHRRVGQ